MDFEWDENKNGVNKDKHGVSFKEAINLWQITHVVVPTSVKYKLPESRELIIGKIQDQIFSCVYTIRRGKIRIISCRKAREHEKRIYYEKIKS